MAKLENSFVNEMFERILTETPRTPSRSFKEEYVSRNCDYKELKFKNLTCLSKMAAQTLSGGGLFVAAI